MNQPEINQLESLLAAPLFKGKAMSIDRLQGFLVAVVSSPDTVLPSQWLPDVVGGETEYDSMEQAQAFMDLLMRFYNEVAAALSANEPIPFILRQRSSTDERMNYQTWCEGYILGWALSSQEWLRPGNEVLKKLTFPILYLSGAFREDAQAKGKAYEEEEDYKVQQECVDVLPRVVQSIYDFWRERRGTPTIRRESPKVGRNDPCPCGSGKKFKQCCGHHQILH
ncbi:MAG: UPF0149 family protein [Sulfuricellaceae bacterium]|nr:UPF0149 family protein [Sulfuricellaceae bacterium]